MKAGARHLPWPALALLWCVLAWAQLAVPPLTAHVIDQTGSLTPQQVAALEARLAAFEARKGSQVAVLIVPTTAPEAIEAYALRVAEQWKLGRARVDDAAILVVAKNDRGLRIEVGYGLEGVLGDAVAKRIISETIAPRFGQQDFAGGIAAGVEQMLRVIDGEPLPPPARNNVEEDLPSYLPALLFAAVTVGLILRALFGRVLGSVATGTLLGAIAWWVVGIASVALIAGGLSMIVSLLGLRILPFLGSGRGSGRRDGSNGGGFHGGGGGFGGGGASGRW